MTGWERYAAAWPDTHGGYDLRRAPAAVWLWARAGYAGARMLATIRVRPAACFWLAVVLAGAIPLLRPLPAAGLVVLSAFAGSLDPALAAATGASLRRATIREAVGARLAEVAILVGFWLAGVAAPLVVACGAVTGLYEYARAQALAAGMSRLRAQTVGDRPTRIGVAVAGLALSGLAGLAGWRLASGLLSVATVIWLLLAATGLARLAAAIHRSIR